MCTRRGLENREEQTALNVFCSVPDDCCTSLHLLFDSQKHAQTVQRPPHDFSTVYRFLFNCQVRVPSERWLCKLAVSFGVQ